MEFKIDNEFIINGEQKKIISGSIHYWRSPHNMWKDKLKKLKALGCNTVETYVPWNLHQPQVNKFNFEDNLNLLKFIELATDLNLMIILRCGPYICAEHDFGGLPWWLLKIDDIRLRCNDKEYLKYVERYLQTIILMIHDHQAAYGGNIIMGQIENEYGSYGNDKEYLKALHEIYRKNDFIMPLVTSDGAWNNMQQSGNLYEYEVYPTVNFGKDGDCNFDEMQTIYGSQIPLMCMEFWCGWFDTWGHPKSSDASLDTIASELKQILERGSVNLYMIHGGTNFGFSNGANYVDDKEYCSHTTSYEYDALLDEAGNATSKYWKCREVIGKYTELPDIKIDDIVANSYGSLSYVGSNSMFDNLGEAYEDKVTVNMERFNQGYGYALYESDITNIETIETLMIIGLRDRANIYLDEELIFTTNFHLDGEKRFDVYKDVSKYKKLRILVENMGRVNYGPWLEQGKKGILNGVVLDFHFQYNWTHYGIAMDKEAIANLKFNCTPPKGAAFHKFEMEVAEVADTYLDMSEFGKGVVFVNNNNIGRFWNIGPQYQLFVPATFLKLGTNTIVIFETEGKIGNIESVLKVKEK